MRSVVFSLCVFACSPAMGTLINPGFEPDSGVGANNILPGGSTAINGWTTTLNGVEWFDAAAFGAASPDGGYAVDLANFTFTGGGIEQTFDTNIGQQYDIEFYYATQQTSGRVGTALITVEAGATSEDFAIENLGAQAVWELRTFTFVADDTQTTLRFTNNQNANFHFAYIDGINVIPTPASIAIALGALGAIRRRR